MDYGGFGEGICADQLVVGRMEGYDDDTDFASDTLRTPREIARVKAEGTVFCITATGTDEMNTLGSDTGVGWLTAFLKSSVSDERGVYIAT